MMYPETEKLLKDYSNNVDKLFDIHPDLYNTLYDRCMIVDENYDESAHVIESWKKTDSSHEICALVINPTMDCNLRCWYCYENHCKKSVMNADTISSVNKFIEKKVTDDSMKILQLDFFGGEPLMYFNEVIYPILIHAKSKCVEHHKKLLVGLTTNGVLLNEDTVNKLCEFTKDFPVSLQITLDGGRECHNAIRHTIDGSPTYDIIVDNIKRCARVGFKVGVRFNYTQANMNTLSDVMMEFDNGIDDYLKNVSFSFHKVWQEPTSDKMEKGISEIKNRFRKNCLEVLHSPISQKYRCYADKEDHIVVNYNGDLYKCTARDFSVENREGILGENGELLWNEKYHYRRSIVYGNSTCQKCSIFPICAGHCSQSKLEYNGNGCVMHYSNEDRMNIVSERVELLMEKAIPSRG